jgi:hypothetical protein
VIACAICGNPETRPGRILDQDIALCWDEATLTLHETPIKGKTAPVLADEGAETTEEQRQPIYTTAPDPDGWSTHDQLEWMERMAS